MKIAIDAKLLFNPQPGGWKSYLEGLIDNLALIDIKNEYCLFVDRLIIRKSLSNASNFKTEIINCNIPIIREVIREQINLRSRLKNFELVHFPCNTGVVRCGLPYIITLHDVLALNNPYFRFVRPLRKSIWNYLQEAYQSVVIPQIVESANLIITVSNYEKSMIINRLPIPSEKIKVIYLAASDIFRPIKNGDIHQLRLELNAKYGINKYILSVGSKPSKNIPGLLKGYEILTTIVKNSPDLVLVIPHPSTEKNFRKITQELNLNNKVHFLPGQSQNELVKLYGLAEIFVFPSFRESFGLPPLEAMACGTPVIVGNTSSLNEVVGEAGIYVNPNKPQEIFESMKLLLEKEALVKELRNKGLKRAMQFSWQQTANMTLDAYNDVVNST